MERWMGKQSMVLTLGSYFLTPTEETPLGEAFWCYCASADTDWLQLWMKREYADAPAYSECLLQFCILATWLASR